VRDYEKYIARQLKRGTSRQELNVSWLKKNELDLKRHVQELRDNIRSNWTTTGQELSRELKQFWPTSRSQSPARPAFSISNGETPGSPLAQASTSASAIPQSSSSATTPWNVAKSPTTPSLMGERTSGNANDFITGYTLGLIGGVRSWVSVADAP
jgi:choline-phosphate cytidylyltransferase